MEISQVKLNGAGVDVPAVRLMSREDDPSAVIIHGIGGNKEEMLGLSFRVVMAGYTVYAVDLRGHGESADDFSSDVREDILRIIADLKKTNRPVIAIGHSLGGRLALLSDADIRVGISPALPRVFSSQTRKIIGDMRMHRVKSSSDGMRILFDEILGKLPVAEAGLRKGDCVIYGSRDVPDIAVSCDGISNPEVIISRIEGAFHGDIINMDETFSAITRFLSLNSGWNI